MATETPFQILLAAPLSDQTRKERRTILAIASIAFGMCAIGAAPKKISALGIDFTFGQASLLLMLLGTVQIYTIAVFIFSALSDYVGWKQRFGIALGIPAERSAADVYAEFHTKSEVGREIREFDGRRFTFEPDAERLGIIYKNFRAGLPFWKVLWQAAPSAFLSALIEFPFPLLMGATGAYVLFAWDPATHLWHHLPVLFGVGILIYVLGSVLAFYRARRLYIRRWRIIGASFCSWIYWIMSQGAGLSTRNR